MKRLKLVLAVAAAMGAMAFAGPVFAHPLSEEERPGEAGLVHGENCPGEKVSSTALHNRLHRGEPGMTVYFEGDPGEQTNPGEFTFPNSSSETPGEFSQEVFGARCTQFQ